MKLDVDDYASILSFAETVKAEVPVVDYLLLNAGIGILKYETSASDHERSTQINYLSNVLLPLQLLPHLSASAARTGGPARVTWLVFWSYFFPNHDSCPSRKTCFGSSDSLLFLI